MFSALRRYSRTIAAVTLLASVAYFALVGSHRMMDPLTRDHDFRQFWGAAKCCMSGCNPYDANVFGKYFSHAPCFVYFPNMLPIVMPLGFLDCSTAGWIWRAMNVIALFAAIHFSILWLAPGASIARKMLMYSFAFFLSGPVAVVVDGQTSLFMLCGIAITGYAIRNSRPYLGGFGLFLGLFKPQIIPVFLLYVLLRRQGKMLFVGAAMWAAATATGILLIHDSPASILLSILHGWREVNPWTGKWMLNLTAFLAKEAHFSPENSFLVTAILGAVVLATWMAMGLRRALPPDAITVPFVVMATLVFMPARVYESVLAILLGVVVISKEGMRLFLWGRTWVLLSLICPFLGIIAIARLTGATGGSSSTVPAPLMDYRHWIILSLFAFATVRYALAYFRREGCESVTALRVEEDPEGHKPQETAETQP